MASQDLKIEITIPSNVPKIPEPVVSVKGAKPKKKAKPTKPRRPKK